MISRIASNAEEYLVHYLNKGVGSNTSKNPPDGT